MSLEIQELRFARRNRVILESITFSLKPGEFVGLLGPNGSGKSTLLKNILGFLKPSGGRVLFAGEGLSGLETARKFGFVPQNAGNPVSMTVRDMILTGRLPHLKDRWAGYTAEDKQMVLDVMETLGITDLADRNTAQISGGELQKAGIARCLVQAGEILLLDEATSGLDLNHTIEIMELMRRKADAERNAVLAVLHDLNLASQYCDSVILLKNGQFFCQGKPAEILNEGLIETVYGVRAVVQADEYGRPFVVPRRAKKQEEVYVY
jgi:iron complex transport system ATP-binding protein